MESQTIGGGIMATIAKLIYLGLMAAGWGVCIAKNGEPRGEYSALTATISLAIELVLLGLAGFLTF